MNTITTPVLTTEMDLDGRTLVMNVVHNPELAAELLELVLREGGPVGKRSILFVELFEHVEPNPVKTVKRMHRDWRTGEWIEDDDEYDILEEYHMTYEYKGHQFTIEWREGSCEGCWEYIDKEWLENIFHDRMEFTLSQPPCTPPAYSSLGSS